MTVSLRDVHRYLIALAIILLPVFNSFGGSDKLGVLGRSASTYPLLIGVVLWGGALLLQKEKIYYPHAISLYFLMGFLIIAILSGLFNLPDLYYIKHQGFSGDGRFLVQLGALIFYLLIVLYVYNIFFREREKSVSLFVNALSISFFLSAGYSLFEIGSFVNIPFSADVLGYVNSLFRSNEELYGLRIRSLANEASMFAMYCSLIFPWIFSRLLSSTKKIWNSIIVSYFVLLMCLSFSRTAYVVFSIQFIVFIFLYRKEFLSLGIRDIYPLLSVFGILCAGVCCIYLLNEELFDKIDIIAVLYSLVSTDADNLNLLSNVARYSSQTAAIQIFFDHPLFGVGLGGFGFYAPQYYPDSFGESWEIIAQSSNIIGGAWPVAHGLYVRILAEMGGLGLFFWLMLWGRELYCAFSGHGKLTAVQWQCKKNLAISLVGILLVGFVGDSLTWAAYWIYLGFFWAFESHHSRGKDI
ncbi:O-antigen ligase family protein [uncultured Selenomonas sp.]|uniref:O-antigen ligase family protein n=1 Tax=uncultured Selenomonas sp. TaxID=159275 RepID=UPI0028D58096|nr:O-antigen ligase family protein [uncultured Selenomonas sp.]